MKLIGLTGSLASGKTTAAGFFRKCGCAVFDADEAARRMLDKDMPGYRQFCRQFSRAYLTDDGSVDRVKVAKDVFRRPALRRQLNRILHPPVMRRAKAFAAICRKLRLPAAVLDVPLLFESGMDRLADRTVVISAHPRHLYARARRRGMSVALAKKIMKTQWSDARKRSRADFVVPNNGTPKQMQKLIKEVFQAIITNA
ncbi:MAG: dephospho-CoA kinase [Candidatus Omnitrophota bacterium]